MTEPDSNQSPPDPQDALKTLTDAFGKLPPLLAYGGLILVAGIVIIWLTGDLSDWLLAVPVVVIVAFLAYTIIDGYFKLKEKQIDAGRLQPAPKELPQNPEPESPPTPESDPPRQPPQPDPLPPDELETLYLKEITYRCGWVSTAAFDPKARHSQAEKLHLASVFTGLDVPREQREEQMSARAERRMLSGREAAEMEKEMRQPVLAALSRHPRLVLLGKAGSGKSTLVNYLALCLAGEQLGETDFNLARLARMDWNLPALLPVRVVLRDYAARGLPARKSLWQFVCDELKRVADGRNGTLDAYAPRLEQRLQSKGGLLLLDGYDEVPEAHDRREQLKEAITDFQRRFAKVRILVTSRPYAYDDPAWQLTGFARTELLDFSPEQVNHYIEQWYRAMAAADPNLTAEQAAAYTEQLQAEIKENPNLRELAPRPLLLALMSLLHRSRSGARLPQERHQLYEESVDLLLDFWEQPKRIYDAQGRQLEEKSALLELGIPKHELRAVLNQVAYEVHKEQPELVGTADIPERQLAGLLYATPSRKKGISIEDIITYIKNRAGLLEDRGPDAQGQHVYTFPHRTFQEYLAACHLSGATFPQEIAALASSNPGRWREALLLAAGRANTDYSVWGLVGKLCQEDFPPPSGKILEEAWQGAFLAGQVLQEKKLTGPVADREDRARRARVLAWHAAILEQGKLPPRDRAQAGQALAALGDPRRGVGVDAQTGLPDIIWGEELHAGTYAYQETKVTIAQPYRLSRYPITNAQFQAFVDAPDKDEAAWWRGLPEKEKQFSQPRFPQANHPRVNVSWYQALAFCRWLTAKLYAGLLPAGPLGGDLRQVVITLPHEYEWEAAARYPHGQAYPWGDDFDAEKANTSEGGIGQTTAVGLYPAGKNEALGLYDLSGNVWEWCRSRYDEPDEDVDPDKLDTRLARRVVRGGSWNYDRNNARAAYRDLYLPDYRFYYVGFRVAVVRRSPSHHLDR